jgi:hypothetical protein
MKVNNIGSQHTDYNHICSLINSQLINKEEKDQLDYLCPNQVQFLDRCNVGHLPLLVVVVTMVGSRFDFSWVAFPVLHRTLHVEWELNEGGDIFERRDILYFCDNTMPILRSVKVMMSE